MKVLLTAPVYISNDIHKDFVEETIASIVLSKDKYEKHIVLVNNYIAPYFYDNVARLGKLINNPDGNNVSGAWNQGIKYGLENDFDYIFVINLDIIFHKDAITNLVEFAEAHPEFVLWSANEWSDRRTISSLEITPNGERLAVKAGDELHDWEVFDEHPHFSCFMVNAKGINQLKQHEEGTSEPYPGLFDVGFTKAYFEDQDYHQRILNAGLKAVKVNSSVFYHYGSRTIKSDEQLELENAVNYEHNRNYFKMKWGYDSHGRVPSNEERVQLAYATAFNKPRVTNTGDN